MGAHDNEEVKIIFREVDNKKYTIEAKKFLDKSAINDEGKYDYYYSGFNYHIKVEGVNIYARKYDHDDYVWFLKIDIDVLTKHLRTIKKIFTEEFSIRHFTYRNSINQKDIYYYWCSGLEDEDKYFGEKSYRYGVHVSKCKIYYSNDVLRCDAEFNIHGKLNGFCKLYSRDGTIKYEGVYNNEKLASIL